MKKKIFYIIRYSILQDTNQWKMSRENEFIDYQQALFDDARLNLKYFLFSHLTLPSIVGQKRGTANNDFEIILLTSTELPKKHLANLNKLAKQTPQLVILPIKPQDGFVSELNGYLSKQLADIGEDTVYATVRIDDDDMINPMFEQRLRSFTIKANTEYMVTFSQGHEVYLDSQNKLQDAIELSYPKIALGLSLISFYSAAKQKCVGNKIHVYQTGKHTTVNQRFNLIDDQTPDMYVRVSYQMQDTQADGFVKRQGSAEKSDINLVRRLFPMLDKCLPKRA